MSLCDIVERFIQAVVRWEFGICTAQRAYSLVRALEMFWPVNGYLEA